MGAVSTVAPRLASSIREPGGPTGQVHNLSLAAAAPAPDDARQWKRASRRRSAMDGQRVVDGGDDRTAGHGLRQQLLANAPVAERRLHLAGVSTAVLEGGTGAPVVLLHGKGGWAGAWLPVMSELVRGHHVVAPDLPGLGASRADHGPPGAATALDWLGELID